MVSVVVFDEVICCFYLLLGDLLECSSVIVFLGMMWWMFVLFGWDMFLLC